MKYLLFIPVLLIGLLTGCPYSSPHKAGTPLPADESWNAYWVSQKIENGKLIQDVLEIKKSGKYQLSVLSSLHIMSAERSSRQKLKAYPVRIGAQEFLLFYNPKNNEDKKYMYVGYKFLTPDKLELKTLSDKTVPENLSTREDLEKWLTDHASHPELWEDTLIFEKGIQMEIKSEKGR